MRWFLVLVMVAGAGGAGAATKPTTRPASQPTSQPVAVDEYQQAIQREREANN